MLRLCLILRITNTKKLYMIKNSNSRQNSKLKGVLPPKNAKGVKRKLRKSTNASWQKSVWSL